ncbi:MAG: aromatase/cyclase [Chloroflexia bacterium]
MPLVEVDEIMQAPVDMVWEVVNDVEAYPRLMEHVRSLKVLEHGPNYRHLAWEVDLKGCVMSWVEREEIDHERYRIDYRQIEGDLAEFEGYWQLEPLTADTCRATLAVQFDIGIPMLSEMINPIAERAIRDNSLKMLHSLGSEAASEAEREASVQGVR